MNDESQHLYAVILAGGSGARFWPLSRELTPKQLLTIFGTESLIAQAVHRILPVVDSHASSVTIVTNERVLGELRNDLAGNKDRALREIDYMLEPAPRNTAPAIALAAAVLEAKDPEAIMIVLPSDHILDDGDEWRAVMASAVALAEASKLVTVGLQPTRPETGYGYIESAEELPEFSVDDVVPRRVARFVEKPDLETARGFLETGRFFWNGGMFVMRAAQVLDELASASEDGAAIVHACRHLALTPREEWAGDEARGKFLELPEVSIDRALMERSPNVAVIPADLGWNDVGSLLALETLVGPDERGNVRVGRGVDVESSDCVVYSTDRLVATLGLEDLLVIDTADATLVCPKDRAQDVRLVVDALRAVGAGEVVQARTSQRPWGSWTTLLEGQNFRIKLIEVNPGAKLSLQKHHHRSEHWVVVSGSALATRGDESYEVHVNESTIIPIGERHRLENCGLVPLRVIEVQVGEYVGEDDIVRLQDEYER